VKNISLLLNVVLIIAVAFLYYKIYNGSTGSATVQSAGSGSLNTDIVFINSDTLLEDFEYFKTWKAEMDSKEDSIDNVLNAKAKSLESDVMKYQENAPLMSPEQRAGAEEKLMARQQQLMQLKQDLVNELTDKESAMNDSLHDKLYRYLHEYNKDRNYKFILGYQRGGGILLANDSLDITKEILEGLNAAEK